MIIKKIITLIFPVATLLLLSCNNSGKTAAPRNDIARTKILQQKDGTISLKVEKADCYQDKVNPSSNTAEWSVQVSKSGRFSVWLSSATKDTTDLKYNNSVMLSILDDRIEAHPAPDKIIRNSTEVSPPYYRADSFLGSLYIQDTGIFNVQIISDKIRPKGMTGSNQDNSKILSVFLTPESR